MRRLLASFALFAACRGSSPPPSAHPDTPPPTPVDAGPPATAPPDANASVVPAQDAPAEVERIAVPKDSPTSIVRGPTGVTPHIVFMPGLCSNAYAYLLSFPEAARAHGGVVAIDGDQACGDLKDFHSFSWSATLQRKRVEAALAAAGVAKAPEEGFILVGYSAGASIAELMHQRWPDLFTRLVLIAPPSDPSVDRLRKARAVVSMSCSLDVPYRMKQATRSLSAAHVASIYLEMPKCTHGQIADGEHVFGEAFDWLDARRVD